MAFRFGLVAAQTQDAAQFKEMARRAEAAGFSSLIMPDTSGPVLSPFSALATAAAVTTTLRVGNWVLAGDFRNPVLLAREAATLDFLSEGRYELGVGAGRDDNDYASLGLTRPASGGVRLNRVAESLEIIDRLFQCETVTFHGQYYDVDNARLYPRPLRRLPILMAASRPRAIKLAAHRASIVALAAGSTEWFLQQRQALQDAAGERFASIELATIVWPVPDDDAAAAEASRTMLRRVSGMDADTLIGNRAPTVLAGSRESMIDQLQERRETLGISYIAVGAQAAVWFAPIVGRLAGT
jgi:probable F420-dependent oxidoreductase